MFLLIWESIPEATVAYLFENEIYEQFKEKFDLAAGNFLEAFVEASDNSEIDDAILFVSEFIQKHHDKEVSLRSAIKQIDIFVLTGVYL